MYGKPDECRHCWIFFKFCAERNGASLGSGKRAKVKSQTERKAAQRERERGREAGFLSANVGNS